MQEKQSCKSHSYEKGHYNYSEERGMDCGEKNNMPGLQAKTEKDNRRRVTGGVNAYV